MGKQLSIQPNNLQHNVPAILDGATGSLRALAQVYFVTEVAGQAPGTIDAKRRDLSRFLAFYTHLYGHDRPAEWYASVTREFVRGMAREKLAEATCARTYASVRHFARWIHQKAKPFPLGCPTDGIKPPREPDPEWKGLSRADELRLTTAAQTLRLSPGRGTNQGLRNQAALAVLLGSGLRVTELVNLDRAQYTGRGFTKVLVKGGRVRDVAVQRDAREVLDDWLRERGDKPGPLFPTRTRERLTRVQVFKLRDTVESTPPDACDNSALAYFRRWAFASFASIHMGSGRVWAERSALRVAIRSAIPSRRRSRERPQRWRDRGSSRGRSGWPSVARGIPRA